jgi:type IV pilus assembly protein PilA
MPKLYKKFKAFSLIEILIVVALMIILATITIIAINPAKNFQDTRNAQRSSDVSAILNAVTQYTSEEGRSMAALATEIGATIPVCPDTICIGSDATCANLAGTTDADALVEEYIVAIPIDPADGFDETNTGYEICTTDSGRVEISAPGAVADGKAEPITVKR